MFNLVFVVMMAGSPQPTVKVPQVHSTLKVVQPHGLPYKLTVQPVIKPTLKK